MKSGEMGKTIATAILVHGFHNSFSMEPYHIEGIAQSTITY